jgi:hypothetical protein
MDTEREQHVAAYYRHRLTASAFGSWLSFLSDAKVSEEDALLCAIDYHNIVVREKFWVRMKRMVSRSAKCSYTRILADTMRGLLQKQNGFQSWRAYCTRVRQLHHTRPRGFLTASDVLNGPYRLFIRWNRRRNLHRRISQALRCAIRSGAANSFLISVRTSFSRWSTVTRRSQLCTACLSDASRHWKERAKRNVMSTTPTVLQLPSMLTCH